MEFKEFISMFLMVAGGLFGYHKYVIGYIDKKKAEVDKEIDTLSKSVSVKDNEIKEQLKNIEKTSNVKDTEIKDLIREIKEDIKGDIREWRKELKEEIKDLRDRQCKAKID